MTCRNTTVNKILIPTTLFGPVYLYQHLAISDTCIFEKHESYLKQSFRNRYQIGAPNKIQDLSIPVKKINGNNTLSSEVEIDYSSDWIGQHLKSMDTAYHSSPFHLYYIDYIAEEFNKKHIKLWDLNEALFLLLRKWLNLNFEIEYTQDYHTDYEDLCDLRTDLHPKKSWHKESSKNYTQCFDDKFGFRLGLSIIDLLFNLGPESSLFLKN